jgi:hypothetical protein
MTRRIVGGDGYDVGRTAVTIQVGFVTGDTGQNSGDLGVPLAAQIQAASPIEAGGPGGLTNCGAGLKNY